MDDHSAQYTYGRDILLANDINNRPSLSDFINLNLKTYTVQWPSAVWIFSDLFKIVIIFIISFVNTLNLISSVVRVPTFLERDNLYSRQISLSLVVGRVPIRVENKYNIVNLNSLGDSISWVSNGRDSPAK